MKTKSVVACCALLVGLFAAPPPAKAVDVLLVRGVINVQSDFSACGTVTFTNVQKVITGQLSAAGWAQNGTGTVMSVRDAQPILAMNTNRVQVCTEGVGSSPDRGAVSYLLTANGTDGDTSTYKVCFTNTSPSVPFQCVNV